MNSISSLIEKIPPEVLVNVNQISDCVKITDTLSAHMSLKISEKQDLLETKSLKKRLEKIISHMENEIDVLQVEKKSEEELKDKWIRLKKSTT